MIEIKLTNREMLDNMTNEELANWIVNLAYDVVTGNVGAKSLRYWLDGGEQLDLDMFRRVRG